MKLAGKSLFAIISLAGLVSLSLVAPKVSAASIGYNPANLLSQQVFVNTSSMSQAAIQNFLVNEGSGLARYSQVSQCYNSYMHYNCGKNEPASEIIYEAAQSYNVNPQVILSTLQKEQSLVTTPNPTSSQLAHATGYGCPDSGGCDSSYYGFFNQVDWATWQLAYDTAASAGNSFQGTPANHYPCPSTTRYYSTGLYSGRSVTFKDDGGTSYSTLTLASAPTAALYCYTPHTYNNPQGLYGNPQYGTKGSYYSGSYNFEQSFMLWFGSTQGVPKVNVSQVTFSAQPFSDSSITASFTLTNVSKSTLFFRAFLLAARDPNGGNVDFPAVNNISIAPGASYTYRQTRTMAGVEGKYQLFIGYFDDTNWGSPAFASFYQMNDDSMSLDLIKHPTLTSGLTLSTSDLHVNQDVTASFAVTNNSSTSPINIGSIGVAASDSSSHNVDFSYGSNVTIAPGATYNYSSTRRFTSTGNYNFWIADWTPSYGWSSSYPTSASSSLARSANPSIKPQVLLVSPLAITTSDPHTTNPITATFSVKNYGSASANIGSIGVAARDPSGANVDFGYGSNVTIAPGATYNFSASRSFSTTGAYRAWIAQTFDGRTWSSSYPTSAVSGMARSIDLTVLPQVELTQPLAINAPDPTVNKPITTTFQVTNFGSTSANIGSIGVAARDSSGHNVDFDYGSNVTIAPGATYNYSSTSSFASPTSYKFWIADYRPSFGWNNDNYPASQTSSMTRNLTYDLANDVRLINPLAITRSGNDLTASFSITNYSKVAQDAGSIGVAVRNAQNHNADFLPYASNLVLQPGQSYTYNQTQSFSSGTYHAWIADNRPSYGWNDTNYPASQTSGMLRNVDVTIK